MWKSKVARNTAFYQRQPCPHRTPGARPARRRDDPNVRPFAETMCEKSGKDHSWAGRPEQRTTMRCAGQRATAAVLAGLIIACATRPSWRTSESLVSCLLQRVLGAPPSHQCPVSCTVFLTLASRHNSKSLVSCLLYRVLGAHPSHQCPISCNVFSAHIRVTSVLSPVPCP